MFIPAVDLTSSSSSFYLWFIFSSSFSCLTSFGLKAYADVVEFRKAFSPRDEIGCLSLPWPLITRPGNLGNCPSPSPACLSTAVLCMLFRFLILMFSSYGASSPFLMALMSKVAPRSSSPTTDEPRSLSCFFLLFDEAKWAYCTLISCNCILKSSLRFLLLG